MEAVAVLVVGTLILLALVSPFVALAAIIRMSRLEKRLDALSAWLSAIEEKAWLAGPREAPPKTAGPSSAAPPAGPVPAARPPQPPPEPTPTSGPAPPAPAPVTPAPAAPAPAAPAPAATGETPAPPPTAADFATNIGPRILVGAGGLAVVVFLALFVRYAWENDWVGPTGRILMAAVFSLGLVTAGLRLLGRQYRPLGQGLAAAGFAGLYVTGFAAHAVYALVPRAFSAAVMIVVTVCAVAVADRLRTRLLAGLAWVGGYLTPVLLSTGEDRAVSLFAYLLLLGAGTVWLDRRRPWPETLPLGMTGTLLLYGAWYAAHFRPERFAVAAVGLVLLTALFALGTARKERTAGFVVVLLAAAVGLAVLGADVDRPETLLPLSLVLAAVGLRAARPLGLGTAIAAAAGVALPFLAWAGAHYEPDSFGLAAAWVAGGALLLVLGAPSPRLPARVFPAAALIAGGSASVGLASETDRPLALLLLLAVQAGLAVLVRRRWAWAEAAGVALGALAVLAWYDRYFRPDQASEALVLGLGLAGVYVAILAVRGLVLRTPLGVPDATAQIVAAGLAWLLLDRVLTLTQPDLLGLAAAALAALHLALGLTARRLGPAQVLWARVTLALSAVFLTLAIPVQLGLFGITLAWAGEALVLVWLGMRHDSALARVGGYTVLLLAVGRLLLRHLPLHDGPFTPVLNPSFGTWLLVIAAVAAARWMTSAARARGSALDIWAGHVLAPLGLALLFGLCTAETQSFFAERAREARAARDPAAAVAAGRQAGLALSVLWTLFATGLLGAGLALRSRGLFYTAYALFGVTAVKVVLIDLATLPTLYRMLSFLALGVLLLAGAWLNLRFRERLLAPGGDR
ncbi:MAG: DUF2339 domain-containing protein [Acidobacteriota bacterium]